MFYGGDIKIVQNHHLQVSWLALEYVNMRPNNIICCPCLGTTVGDKLLVQSTSAVCLILLWFDYFL